MEKHIETAAKELAQAQAIIITAGAGMGVDSGLPDFRGNTGFWKEYPAISHLGISFSEMANPSWFVRDPNLAWAFYGHRYNLYNETLPHKGFEMLLNFGKTLEGGYFALTSNVDGQFQKAGFKNENIEEVHGSIKHFQCSVPCCSQIWEVQNIKFNIDNEIFKAQEPLPLCPKCGAIARPNILMFGDWHWLPERSENQRQNLLLFLKNIEEKNLKTVIVEIGAGKAIPTIRLKSQKLARATNAFLIRINPRDFAIPEGIKGAEIPLGALEGIKNIFNK